MDRAVVVAALAAIIGAAGCSNQYAYVPTTSATVQMHGRIAADYQIPPEAPRGEVRIASYGITDVSAKEGSDRVLHALHLRVIAANNSATPWTLDTRDQRVDLNGRGPLAPAFASASPGAAPPLVTIPPGGKRVVDLFFLLPPDLQRADELPEFDALWRVDTNPEIVAERTPFERLVIEPDANEAYDWGDYGADYYWGDPYWVNPYYPFSGYGYGYLGGGVLIHRSPHFRGGFRGGYGGAHGGGHWGGGGHGGGGGHSGGGGHGGR